MRVPASGFYRIDLDILFTQPEKRYLFESAQGICLNKIDSKAIVDEIPPYFY